MSDPKRGRVSGSVNKVKGLAVGLTGFSADIEALAKAVDPLIDGPLTVLSSTETAEGKTFTVAESDGTEKQLPATGVKLYADFEAVMKAVAKQLQK